MYKPGLEGVVAFESEIAEPDRDGGSLRYRGVDIEDLVQQVDFGRVWGLLVDGALDPGLSPAEPLPLPVHTGDPRVDIQAAVAALAPSWGIHASAARLGEGLRNDDVFRRPGSTRARTALRATA